MVWTLDTLCHKKNSWMGGLMAAIDAGHGVDTTVATAASN